jgi:hypothetical protein
MKFKDADVAELVDARDLKSLDGNVVWVRVPPPAPGDSRMVPVVYNGDRGSPIDAAKPAEATAGVGSGETKRTNHRLDRLRNSVRSIRTHAGRRATNGNCDGVRRGRDNLWTDNRRQTGVVKPTDAHEAFPMIDR